MQKQKKEKKILQKKLTINKNPQFLPNPTDIQSRVRYFNRVS